MCSDPQSNLTEERVPGSMSQRVVYSLEVVHIDEEKTESAVLPRLLVEIKIEACAIAQAGQRVKVGELANLGSNLVALKQDGAQVNAGGDDCLFMIARASAFAIIKSEGPEHTAISAKDRARPARLEAKRLSQGLIRRPERDRC